MPPCRSVIGAPWREGGSVLLGVVSLLLLGRSLHVDTPRGATPLGLWPTEALASLGEDCGQPPGPLLHAWT